MAVPVGSSSVRLVALLRPGQGCHFVPRCLGKSGARFMGAHAGGTASRSQWSSGALLAAGALGGGGVVASYAYLHGGMPYSGAGNLVPALHVHASHPHKRVLYVMRGPPGSGKSTVARSILKEHLSSSGAVGIDTVASSYRSYIMSTDDFFSRIDETTGKETYTFDFKALRANHERNQTRCAIAMELGVTPLIVDNTMTKAWEMRGYVELAKLHGYEVVIQDIWELDKESVKLEVLKERCAARAQGCPGKEIPEAALERMLKGYEKLPSDINLAVASILTAEPPFRRGEASPPTKS